MSLSGVWGCWSEAAWLRLCAEEILGVLIGREMEVMAVGEMDPIIRIPIGTIRKTCPGERIAWDFGGLHAWCHAVKVWRVLIGSNTRGRKEEVRLFQIHLFIYLFLRKGAFFIAFVLVEVLAKLCSPESSICHMSSPRRHSLMFTQLSSGMKQPWCVETAKTNDLLLEALAPSPLTQRLKPLCPQLPPRINLHQFNSQSILA